MNRRDVKRIADAAWRLEGEPDGNQPGECNRDSYLIYAEWTIKAAESLGYRLVKGSKT